MKKVLFTGALTTLLWGSVYSQSELHKWNIGIHGGAHNYYGDLGNGLYNFSSQAYYGLGGVSVSRYLSRHFDASIYGARGEVGYVRKLETWIPDDGSPRNFLARVTTVNALLRYFPLGRTRFVQPYLTGGLGIVTQRPISGTDYSSGSPSDFAIPALGFGLNFPIGKIISLQYQQLFIHNSSDGVDRINEGMNDIYLLHSMGLTFNLYKFWKKGAANGDEKDIDKCMKLPKELEQKTSAKKAKKSKTNGNGKKSRKKIKT